MGYGHAKQALFELILDTFDEPRKRFNYQKTCRSDHCASKGAEKARQVTQSSLRVRSKIGY